MVVAGNLGHPALLDYVISGVQGLLTTDHTIEELISSIEQVQAGRVSFAPDQLVELLNQPPAQSVPRPLAPREVEVLQVLGTGVSTQQAAEQLAMSVHTLRTHLKHAMRKLQARSRLEAVLIAYNAGLIELPS
jgi:DNA-binding NarL/FixJ family response regulator